MKHWRNKEEPKIDEFEINHACSRGREKRSIKNPIRCWRLMVLSLIAFIAFIGFGYGVISYAYSNSICVSCHEMAPQHLTFEASAHKQIKCTQCHINPREKSQVLYKVDEIKRVYSHFTATPETITKTAIVSSESCEQCHSRNRLVTATGDTIVNHKGHIDAVIPCVTCHSGVAHAKIVERGISDSSTYSAWNPANTKKLIGDKNVKPNMGTCIDCHEQVNLGEKPWLDEKYSLQASHVGSNKENILYKYDTTEANPGVLERDLPENTQKIILDAMNAQEKDVKLSMACETCHRKINTPKNHENLDWGKSHGELAVKELEQCLNCHKDSLWIKKLEEQDIKALLDSETESSKKVDFSTAIESSRNNYFCSICHATPPETHLNRTKWLFDSHRDASASPEERQSCFVCHDNEKPEGNKNKAPSDVYCDFCHEGLFPGELNSSNS